MSDQIFYGWYDEPDQPADKPTYDPPHDAPCPFCGKPLCEGDIRTHSLMCVNDIEAEADGKIVSVQKPYAERCYFYRTHRSCDETNPAAMDGFILDMINRNGD